MRCGDQNYFVEYEIEGERKQLTIKGQSQIDVRKKLNVQCGRKVTVHQLKKIDKR